MVDGIDDLTSCALSRVLVATLGGKWKPYIIWYLSLQPHQRARYGELKKIIPYKISDRWLSMGRYGTACIRTGCRARMNASAIRPMDCAAVRMSAPWRNGSSYKNALREQRHEKKGM